MPNGEMTLIVNLHEDRNRVYDHRSLRLQESMRGGILVGAHSQPLVIDCEEQLHVFGVQFRAGAAAAFFRPPAMEFANLNVPLQDLWRGPDLRSRLLECGGDVRAMFDLAERLLLEQWTGRRELHPAVRFAVAELQRNPGPVSKLVDATGLSARRLIELFKEQVGLTPKVFGRLQRFQRALAAVYGAREPDWSAVAVDCGYYDQSHLIRDFREFAGMSPEQYRVCANEHRNHVPIV